MVCMSGKCPDQGLNSGLLSLAPTVASSCISHVCSVLFYNQFSNQQPGSFFKSTFLCCSKLSLQHNKNEIKTLYHVLQDSIYYYPLVYLFYLKGHHLLLSFFLVLSTIATLASLVFLEHNKHPLFSWSSHAILSA